MHHKRDWSKYNRTLVNRGNINLWVTPQVLENWAAKKEKKNGHPFVYGNELIKGMCYIRFKFHLSLRETEGFFLSLMNCMGIINRLAIAKARGFGAAQIPIFQIIWVYFKPLEKRRIQFH